MMESDHEVVQLQDNRNWKSSNEQREAALEAVLGKPFAGRIIIRQKIHAIAQAKAEYDILDLTNKLVLWTDASKHYNRVGIAVVWRAEHFSAKWKHKTYALEGDFRSSDGEFFAIATAIRIAAKISRDRQSDEDSKISNITIYSDCQSSLKIIEDFHLTSKTKRDRFGRHLDLARLKERAQNLVDSGVQLDVKWVKGHKGVPGNVLADKLASRASKSGRDVETLVPTRTSYLECRFAPAQSTTKKCKIHRMKQNKTEASISAVSFANSLEHVMIETQPPQLRTEGQKMDQFVDLLNLD